MEVFHFAYTKNINSFVIRSVNFRLATMQKKWQLNVWFLPFFFLSLSFLSFKNLIASKLMSLFHAICNNFVCDKMVDPQPPPNSIVRYMNGHLISQ